ncbi:hypothetical protein C1645_878358 [Glomus cerebriforme]|uniref:TLDc domain-containing protein n=1 Tax=Glomus cerebriforme TaxID=658196 RepID=A0A397SQP4_9GLOM|nr:hypothetical protein C1645_878358 [Glomus cerebriforme]
MILLSTNLSKKKVLDKLWNHCIQEICCNSNYLFNYTKFINLNPAILEIILKRDDLCINNEIIIWEKRRLSRFIPLIRFYCISSKDFLLKIYPFKELLPNDLVNNILAHHMAPNNKLNINIQPPRLCVHSNIINCQHLSIFASWIVKKETLIIIKLDILFLIDSIYFIVLVGQHSMKNVIIKEQLLVIGKVTNSEQIVGGYNPLFWDSSYSWMSTNDSFIFSFKDRTDL